MSDLVYLAPLVALYLLSVALLVTRIRPSDRAAARQAHPYPADANLRLWIESTVRPQLRNTRFLVGFGFDLRSVRDIRVYEGGGTLECLPSRLIALLFDLYKRGAVRGAEVMALLFHGRPLGEGEALYFALVDLPPEPSVVAFIDRRHERADGVVAPP